MRRHLKPMRKHCPVQQHSGHTFDLTRDWLHPSISSMTYPHRSVLKDLHSPQYNQSSAQLLLSTLFLQYIESSSIPADPVIYPPQSSQPELLLQFFTHSELSCLPFLIVSLQWYRFRCHCIPDLRACAMARNLEWRSYRADSIPTFIRRHWVWCSFTRRTTAGPPQDT